VTLTDVLEDYELEVEDRFDGDELNHELWIPYHLPHWSSREQAAARYELTGGALHLRIDADQPPWSPELDGTTRVSSLQTGVFAGPLGSRVGQHRFNAGAIVREEQPERRLYTPQYGVFTLRARGLLDPDAMVALWMIGVEDRPERSAEICICELFGRDAGREAALVGMGVHPFGDPSITDDFEQVPAAIDVREPHEYAAEWTPERVTFFVDGLPVRTVGQSPAYPMQFMLGIYDFAGPDAPAERYPKRFVVERFRGYRRR
jgi:hypothetical protein